MTAHDFARQLLSGPDLPILVPKVREYDDDEDNCCADPFIVEDDGKNRITGDHCRILIIDQAANSHSRIPQFATRE
jgi:hypothetical protein